jgi:hypothetical protein
MGSHSGDLIEQKGQSLPGLACGGNHALVEIGKGERNSLWTGYSSGSEATFEEYTKVNGQGITETFRDEVKENLMDYILGYTRNILETLSYGEQVGDLCHTTDYRLDNRKANS